MSQGWSGLIRTDNSNPDSALFTSKNNRFENNTYVVPSASGKYWDWMNARRTWNEWRGFAKEGALQLE
ncbi:hypothetical protein D3C85_1921640 [compost metagenome]